MGFRQFARVKHELIVDYDHYNEARLKDDEGMAKVLDLSVQGVLLQMPRPQDEETRLRVSLMVEDQPIDVYGTVRRCEEREDGMYDVGVELEYVEEKFIQAVEKFLSDQSV